MRVPIHSFVQQFGLLVGHRIKETTKTKVGFYVTTAMVAVAIFTFDLAMPLGVAGGVPYVALMLLGLQSPWHKYSYHLAALATVLTILGYLLSPEAGTPWVVLTNRALALFAIWVTGVAVFKNGQKIAELQKTNSLKLAEKSLLLETSLENMAHGFCVYDADHKMVAYNKKYLLMARLPEGLDPMGMSHEQIIRHRATCGIFGEGNEDKIEEKIHQRLKQTATSDERELERTLPNGTVFVFRRKPMPDGGFVATYTDITERKRVQEELANHVLELEDANSRFGKQGQELAALAEDISLARDEADNANKAKSSFLTNMSHELRTPLNAIIGFSEIIKNEMLGPVGTPKYRDYAKDVFDSGHLLLQLINDLLDLSKIEAGKTELDEKDIDVVQAIQSCQKLVSERARKGNVKLLSDFPDTLPMLYFDELKFKQIVLNLLSNAVKFTPEGGKVSTKIWSEPENGYFFQVTDTGIGIAQEDIPKALSSFGQINIELAKAYKGTGLGLPICKALVELGGGVIEMQSEIGKGTTVTIQFPKERISQGSQAKRASSAAE